MSWLERLQPASFRGVPFFVATDDAEFGRRQVTHTAALVDVPTLEDLGRAADIFQVEGYLVGDDYDLTLAELIKAIRDTPGEGRLVHPRYGEKSVGASGFRVRHDNKEGRMCRFTVTFGEAGELSQPTQATDAPNALAERAGAISEVAEESFVDKFVANGFPQYVRDSATSTLTSIGEYLAEPASFLSSTYNDASGVFAKVNGYAAGAVDFVSENVSAYSQSVSDFLGDISELIEAPSDLASRITDIIGGVRGTFGLSSGSILSGLLSIFPRSNTGGSSGDTTGGSNVIGGGNYVAPVPATYTTPSREQVAINQEAIVQIVRQTVAAQLGVVAVSQEYETLDDAIDVRDVVAEVIDGEALASTSDAVYQQLVLERAEVIANIPSPDQSQARAVAYVPPAVLPALLIAQTLYDDATREAQIVTRNVVRHPGFVPGGQPLEVLTDA
jgi:prophage DNA circulation protein